MTPTRIALLGRLAIDREDASAAPTALPGRRSELVFAYLAAEHGRTVSRDHLADALWPDALPDTWAAALRGVVTEVRRYLEDAGIDPSESLISGRGGYQLALPDGVVVDLDEARAAFEAARDELAAGAPAAAAAHAERCSALARMPFLPQHEGEWVDSLREELESLHVRALELLVRARADADDARGAAEAAERLVRAEPYREAAHRLRIEVLGAAGDRAGAARAYQECRRVLSTELGVEPSAETEAAYRRAVEQPTAEPAARPREEAEPSALAGYSVLVVEDHDFQRQTALRLLRSLGVGTLAEAPDGRAALDLLATSDPPDVIMCDLDMPGMDGVEFIRHVAESRLASAVIIASGLDRRVLHAVEAVTEGYGLPVLGAVEKPVTARRLAELLAAYQPAPSPGPGDDARLRVTARHLIEALDAGRIVAHFRPAIDLSTGQVSGAHAVAHWDDPGYGPIAPPAFLPVLEAEGLAAGFVDRMLALAYAHLRDFAAADLQIGVSIELPRAVLADPALADRLAAIAHEHGADPRRICWTVGERIARSEATGALAGLTRLRLKGFGLFLDDFGTGQAGAEVLERLPVTGVRIAAGIVSGAARDPRRLEALEAALALAHGIGGSVLATGCDDASDFETLLQLGCGHAEGAFVSEAMPGAELPAWAGRWRPPASVVGGSQ